MFSLFEQFFLELVQVEFVDASTRKKSDIVSNTHLKYR